MAKLERSTVVGKAEVEPVLITLEDLIHYAERDQWDFIDFLSNERDTGIDAEYCDLTFN